MRGSKAWARSSVRSVLYAPCTIDLEQRQELKVNSCMLRGPVWLLLHAPKLLSVIQFDPGRSCFDRFQNACQWSSLIPAGAAHLIWFLLWSFSKCFVYTCLHDDQRESGWSERFRRVAVPAWTIDRDRIPSFTPPLYYYYVMQEPYYYMGTCSFVCKLSPLSVCRFVGKY